MDADDEQKKTRWRQPENWRFVGAVIDGVAIDLCGENPWRVSWQSMACEVNLPDPIYPGQSHCLNVFSIMGEHSLIVFAAGEFSNGVWGFYLPLDTPGRRTIQSALMRWFKSILNWP